MAAKQERLYLLKLAQIYIPAVCTLSKGPWEISGHAEEGRNMTQKRLGPREDTDGQHKVTMTGSVL